MLKMEVAWSCPFFKKMGVKNWGEAAGSWRGQVELVGCGRDTDGAGTRKAPSLDHAPPKVHGEDPGSGGHLACVSADHFPLGVSRMARSAVITLILQS